jgi:hypothetical protein
MAKQQIEFYRAAAQDTLTAAHSCFWATGMCKRVELNSRFELARTNLQQQRGCIYGESRGS